MFSRRVKLEDRPALALAVEEELGIVAGLQARVIQVRFTQIVASDLTVSSCAHQETLNMSSHGQMLRWKALFQPS